MIFRVTMKCPDALERAIEEAAKNEMYGEIDEDRDYEQYRQHVEEATVLCNKWFKYGEYITVEIDTEAKTCVVV